jgi:hypothetical protein
MFFILTLQDVYGLEADSRGARDRVWHESHRTALEAD